MDFRFAVVDVNGNTSLLPGTREFFERRLEYIRKMTNESNNATRSFVLCRRNRAFTVLLLGIALNGCASVDGEKGFGLKSPFPARAAKSTAKVDALGTTTPGSEVGQAVEAKQGIIKNDRSFLQGVSAAVPRLGPITRPANLEDGDDQSLTNGHDIFKRAMEAEGTKRQRLFDSAASTYARAANRLKQSPHHEDALFWLGESCFFADKYPKAMTTFGELIKKYPNSRHIDTICQRRFATAQYWMELDKEDGFDLYPNLTNRRRPTVDTFGHALRQLDRIRFDNPTGKLADDATMAAAIANYKKDRFAKANILFDDLRENFPNSEHQFQAHLLQLECKRKIYAGPDYDGSILDEAEHLIKQLVLQFPNETREHREYLQKVASDVRLKKAQREFELAQYYDRRKEFGAARLTYANVATNYTDTNLSERAESRLAELGGKPDVPIERLQWLADLFPEEQQAKPLIASDTLGKILR